MESGIDHGICKNPECKGGGRKGKVSRSIQADNECLDLDEYVYLDTEIDELDDVVDEIDEEITGHTGMFCDNVRRSDYILVIPENESNGSLKLQFLLGLVRMGMELEFQKAVMPSHEGLLFVKVHAESKLLDHYSEPLGYKKYYKETHLQAVGAYQTIDETMLDVELERGWVKLVRERYFEPTQFSTYERSIIVYSLMRHQPFDPLRSHLGIERLLREKIILTAYALHDGPYFFVQKQDATQANARQVLYYNTIGVNKAHNYMPKHMLQEYYGSGIAFLFTFYEFYNKFLFLLAWVGLVIAILQVKNAKFLSYSDDNPLKDICGERGKRVFLCSDCTNITLCPFQPRNYYCAQVTWASLFDNIYTIVYCIIILLWAAIFYVLWRRHEMFYIWVWELRYRSVNNPVPPIRPEYAANFEQFNDIDGRWSDQEKCHYRFFRYAANGMPALVIILVACVIYYKYYVYHLEWTGLYRLNETLLSEDKPMVINDPDHLDHHVKGSPILPGYRITGTHKILALLTALFYVFMFILEKVARFLTNVSLRFENHRTLITHNRRQAVILFSLACLSCFPIPVFFGWIKGAFYTFPRDLHSDLFNMKCGYYCTDVFALVVFILFMIRVVLWKASEFWMASCSTDFTKDCVTLEQEPSWEREYSLKSVTELQIAGYYNEIVIQFAIIVLLSPWFPLMPLIAFFINWYDIRHKFFLLVKHSQRASILPTDGIMQWNTILKGIIVAIPIVHAITLARNLKMALWGLSPESYYSLSNMTEFDFENFKSYKYFADDIKDHRPHYSEHINDTMQQTLLVPPSETIHLTEVELCYYEGDYATKENSKRFPTGWTNFIDARTQIAALKTTFHKKMLSIVFILIYAHVGILLLLVILYLIPTELPWVLRYMQIEKALKRLYVVSDIKIPEDHLVPSPDKDDYWCAPFRKGAKVICDEDDKCPDDN